MLGKTAFAPHSGAREDPPSPLVGVWELQAARRDGMPLEGAMPHACLLFTPKGKIVALLFAGGWYGTRSDKIAAAFRAAFAYSGTYRVVGDAWITTQQRSWSDVSMEGEQMHFFSIEDDVMIVRPGRGEFLFRKRT